MDIETETEQEHDEFERIEKLSRSRRTNDGAGHDWFYMSLIHGYPVSPVLRSPYEQGAGGG